MILDTVYVKGYKHLRDMMNKKMYTDMYIVNAARKYKTDNWDEELIREVFQDLSIVDFER